MRKQRVLKIVFVTAILCPVKLLDARVRNFDVVSRSKYFVDQTARIKEILNDETDPLKETPQVTALHAPLHFGKSVAIDMFKRFAQIPCDPQGRRLPVNESKGYRLFCGERPLEICRDRDYVEQHLGQHPVVHVSFHRLHLMRRIKAVLTRLRPIVRNSFLQHKYLATNESLFADERERDSFGQHLSLLGARNLTAGQLQHAFAWLTSLLCRHFGRKALVLLDEYAAYDNDALTSNILLNETDTNEVQQFACAMFEELLRDNACLERALLMGVYPHRSSTNAVYYPFLRDHRFSLFLGFTQAELDAMLERLIKDDESKLRAAQKNLLISYDSNPYIIQNVYLYNSGVVVKSLVRNLRKPDF